MTFGPGSQVSVHLAGFWICGSVCETSVSFGQVGVDVPLSLKQQDALNLLPNHRGDHQEEVGQRFQQNTANIEEIWDNHWTKQGNFPANHGWLPEAIASWKFLELEGFKMIHGVFNGFR